MTAARWRAAFLASAAVVACAGPQPELTYWDEARRAGIASSPTVTRTYEVADPEGAWRVMEERCGSQAVEVADDGFTPTLRSDYPDWPGVSKRGVLRGPLRYYWLFTCVPAKPASASAADAPVPRLAAELRLLLDAPSEDTRVVGTPLVEVRGSATGRGLEGHDVVIVLDLSDSTLRHSGFDIDGDGPEGRTRADLAAEILAQTDDRAVYQRIRDEDFDDSVLMAVLTAAKVLIDQLDFGEHRAGLVAFSHGAVTVAPVGSERATLLESLRRLRVTFPRQFLEGTNFGAALSRADHDLGEPGERERSVVFLSDGKPTVPLGGEGGAVAARRAARWLALSGTRVYSFALGPDAIEALPVLGDMAEITGGRVVKLESPGDVIVALRDIDLADLAELRIENRTTRRAARAVRVSPTGSFDGFVDLQPGPNTLAVTARLGDGRTTETLRVVEYDPAAESPAEVAALKQSLQRRALELRLWEDMRRERRRQDRVLELSLDDEKIAP